MENKPNFRIIGNISQEEKKQQKEEINSILYERHLFNLSEELKSEVEKSEHKKTESELMLIDFANQKTNELMESLGSTPYTVPAINFHLLPADLYRKICKNDNYATTFHTKQGIFMNGQEYQKNDLFFSATAFHELLHLKSHFTMEVNKNPEGKLTKTPYREGLAVRALQESGLNDIYYDYFRGLYEAVVSSYEIPYTDMVFELPMFKEEKEWMHSKEAQEIKKKISLEERINEQEIYWVSRNGKDFLTPPYPDLRKTFDYILEEIYLTAKNKFNSRQEVKNEFLKSSFNGNLLPIAKLVENTFGKGSFRLLGMMENSKTSIQVLKSLKTARQALKKEES